jgi:predicted lipoprotein with Yx(FWY)xxD motif
VKLTRLGVCLPLFLATAAIAVAEGSPESIKKEHPGDVALSKTANDTFEYKSFPALLKLYVSARDGRDKSNCNSECQLAWPPLLVSATEAGKQVGDWTIIVRDDGNRQWAYKGQPVYTRFHDMPLDSDGEQQGFRLLKP